MPGPYTYSAQHGSSGLSDVHYRVQDAQDNRIATCYLEENARLVVTLMNDGMQLPGLLSACRQAVNLSQHADGCRWFDIPLGELNDSPESQAKQFAKCDCHLKACRLAIAKATGNGA